MKDMFLELAIHYASVICCHSSPKQKALVARLVKVKVGKTILAIDDGANDVGMLQEVDIGVGISGAEGMQDIERDRRRRDNPEAMDEDVEDEVVEIKAAHFEELMKYARRSASDADSQKYQAFAQTLQ